MIALPLAIALVASGPTDEQIRKAVDSSILYLQEEAVDWIRDMKCASCHHAPMAVWTLHEAKARGFSVDEAALAELVKSSVDDPVASKLLPQTEGKPSPDSFAFSATYGAIANRAVPSPSDAARASLARLDAYLVATHGPDGSWSVGEGRPPMLESAEIATLMTLLALGREGPAGEARARAEAWLRQRPAGSLQAQTLRLMVATRSGAPEASAIEAILKAQNPDGGWSQTPAMPSDAYATGMALFALAETGTTGRAIDEARDFLVRTQTEDGCWTMTSRPAKEGDGPAKDLRPITYTGTAWATLGLLRSSSR